ncbi:MAG: phospholipase D-like domain-containing protein [Caldisericum sp.]|uniref:phospholipase D-like domain-containing protein n=1 Tax=Caldisericum sp. TaxID=2499687 RepID=UPI003D143816
MKKLKLLIIAFIILSVIFLGNFKTAQSESTSEILISETFGGKQSILNELMKAKNELLINIYGFSDFDFIPTIINLAKQGVEVKVILEEAPYQSETQNFDIRDMLKKYGIEARWANPKFFLTHAKYIVIDDTEAIVLTGNFTYSSFSKNREFGLATLNKDDVNSLRNLFYADWNRTDFKNDNPNVIISPIDSREKIENALKSAKFSIKIWEQSISDQSIIKILKEQKAKGIDVKILMPTSYAADVKNELGDSVLALPNPYIHAKTFIIDDAFAYIGSNNFTQPSLDNERETALFTYNKDIIDELELIWNWDLSHAVIP